LSAARLAAWVVLATLFAVFAATNWTGVALAFGAAELVVKLPVLLLAAAALGYVAGAFRTRLRHRRRVAPPPVSTALPSEAQPTVVPPGFG